MYYTSIAPSEYCTITISTINNVLVYIDKKYSWYYIECYII